MKRYRVTPLVTRDTVREHQLIRLEPIDVEAESEAIAIVIALETFITLRTRELARRIADTGKENMDGVGFYYSSTDHGGLSELVSFMDVLELDDN